MQNKLNTILDRLLRRVVASNASRIICNEGRAESHDHLFFARDLFPKLFGHPSRGKARLIEVLSSWDEEKEWLLIETQTGKF